MRAAGDRRGEARPLAGELGQLVDEVRAQAARREVVAIARPRDMQMQRDLEAGALVAGYLVI